jgi:WASH complex subunit 7
MMGIFKDIYDLIKMLSPITKNMLYQVNAMLKKKTVMYDKVFKRMIFNHFFDMLGEALTVLVTLDVIVTENKNFVAYWTMYNRMFLKARDNAAFFGTNKKDIRYLEKFCKRLTTKVLTKQLFLAYNQDLATIISEELGKEGISKNKEFYEKYNEYLKLKTKVIEEELHIKENSHKPLLSLLTNYALMRALFPKKEDSSLYKKIWSLQKICPLIVVYNNLTLNVGNFLSIVCPLKKRPKLDPKSVTQFLGDTLEKFDANFMGFVNKTFMRVVTWIIEVNSRLFTSLDDGDKIELIVERRAMVLIRGINMAYEIKRTIKQLLFLHQAFGKNLNQDILNGILQCIEMLKSMEEAIEKKSVRLNNYTYIMLKIFVDKIIRKMRQAQVQLKRAQPDPGTAAVLAALKMSLRILKDGFGSARESVFLHCLDFLSHSTKSVFKKEDIADIEEMVVMARKIRDWKLLFTKATRCTFLYWVRSLIPTIFKHIFKKFHRFKRIIYVCRALEDPIIMLRNIKHLESPNIAIANYKKYVTSHFDEVIIQGLCSMIEKDLRIQIHGIIVQKLKQQNPLDEAVYDYMNFLNIDDIILFENRINLKVKVSQYLSEKFYEMTALTPLDWKTYEHIRVLAKNTYGLEILETHLPSKTTDQNIDILMLVRNIHKFCSNYHYNLHTQVFVEKAGETKQIKTVGTSQMLQSLRTHGFGFLNSAVNSIYKYMVKLISMVSEFMHDEYINSPLLVEAKDFKRSGSDRYPYLKAHQMSKVFKGLGNVEGVSYMDKFREVITMIGNALGYVRLIRTASIKDSSNMIKFIPEQIKEPKFAQFCQEMGIEGDIKRAAELFDESVKILYKQEAEAKDYLRELVKGLDGVFKGEENKHMRQFYMIIPPLTINFVESLQRAKEKVWKKRQVGTYIFDDGFAVGLAYILRILHQNKKFGSLNWFESIEESLKSEEEAILKARQMVEQTAGDNKELNSMLAMDNESHTKINLKQIRTSGEEYTLLYYSFNAAQIFFKEMDED